MVDDRVHPTDDTESVRDDTESVRDDTESVHSSVSGMDSFLLKKAKPGSYVIQIQKDQIYRVPPPENARLFESYSRRARRRSARCCGSCRCVAWALGVLLLVAIALAAAAGVTYLVSRPELPRYTVDRIAIKGLDLGLGNSNPVLSPEFDLVVRADNPNKKIGIDYRSGSTVSVSYADAVLADGTWPTFYQGARNTTLLQVPLKGSGVRLSTDTVEGLRAGQGRGDVPMRIDVRVPVRVGLGSIKSWTIKVRVRCDVVVDKLSSSSKIVSRSCKARAHL